MLSRLFIAALEYPASKGLTSWLLFVMCNCVFFTFLCNIMGQAGVHSSIAIILMGKRELIALLNLSSWCLVMV